MESININCLFRTVVLIVFIVNIKCDIPDEQTNAMLYLSNFGYLPTGASNLQSGAILDEKTWNTAIVDFQSFAGIETTGKLDKDTLETMKLPRCGVKDKGIVHRSKRYILQGSRWKVKHITYRISKYPKVSNFNDADVNAEIQRAFDVWSKYTDLTFERKERGQVHIEIQFVYGEHGDGDPFDGPGGTLAHAYFPVFGGDAHFDADERWTINEFRGTNLFQVAAHEFGHSLGLSHSKVKDALMAPFYRGYQPDFKLHNDDIQGIQALYGEKSGYTPTTSKPKKPAPKPTSPPGKDIDSILCESPKMDTIFTTADDSTYMFKGDYYWKVGKETVESGYPKRISDGWAGLPGHIDGAFTYSNGKTYFFKGKQYWRYIGRRMEPGYPKDISVGFSGIPDNIDTVMVWSGNGKIYFFKGKKFWRFDPSARPPVKNTYPKLTSNWEGIPDNLDAAFQYTNEYTYFFKGEAYYRFNDRAFAVESAQPAFPRSVAYWWYGCKSANSLTLGKYRQQNEDIYMAEKNNTNLYSNPEEFNFEAITTMVPKDSGASRSVALFTLVTVTLVALFLNS